MEESTGEQTCIPVEGTGGSSGSSMMFLLFQMTGLAAPIIAGVYFQTTRKELAEKQSQLDKREADLKQKENKLLDGKKSDEKGPTDSKERGLILEPQLVKEREEDQLALESKQKELESQQKKIEEAKAEIEKGKKILEAEKSALEIKEKELASEKRKLEDATKALETKEANLESRYKADLAEKQKSLQDKEAAIEIKLEEIQEKEKKLESEKEKWLETRQEELEHSNRALADREKKLEEREQAAATESKAEAERFDKQQQDLKDQESQLEQREKALETRAAELKEQEQKLEDTTKAVEEQPQVEDKAETEKKEEETKPAEEPAEEEPEIDEEQAKIAERRMRKKLIKEELATVIKEAETNEMEEPFEPEAVEALEKAAMKVCYLKKYYDVMKDDFIYFPDVNATIASYALLEEAEKYYFEEEDEFPMVYSGALREIALNAVAAKDDDLDFEYMEPLSMDMEVGEVEDEEEDEKKEEETKPAEEPAEEEPEIDEEQAKIAERRMRKKLIKEELATVIKEAETNEMEEPFEPEAVEALEKAAMKVCYLKKYYDVMKDDFIYFPDVNATIASYALLEEAEKYYFEEEDEFPMVYSGALREIALNAVAAKDDDLDFEYMEPLSMDMEVGEVEDEEEDEKKEEETKPAEEEPEMDEEQVKQAERDMRKKMIEDELNSLIKEAETTEMEEPFEPEAVEALMKGAMKVCYLKKYYDVMKDDFIFFPDVNATIASYALIEEAEKHYFDEEDEFPMVYSGALREIALNAVAAKGDDLDFEYMEPLSMDMEV